MLDPVWEELVARLERGATLAEVEEALVEVPGLSEDERAPFGWQLGRIVRVGATWRSG